MRSMFDGSKEQALHELLSVMREQGLARSTVGRQITGDPHFIKRMEDPDKTVSTKTLDKVWRFILRRRGQAELNV